MPRSVGCLTRSASAVGLTGSPDYQGCFTDDASRALPVTLMSSGATVETCVAAAKEHGFAYAGVQWYGWCFAGDMVGYSRVSDDECTTPCDADPNEMCGGAWRNSIYAVTYP